MQPIKAEVQIIMTAIIVIINIGYTDAIAVMFTVGSKDSKGWKLKVKKRAKELGLLLLRRVDTERITHAFMCILWLVHSSFTV